jgi:chromosome segregation ATPase
MAADDNGADMLTELQESLKAQRGLEATVKSLQEKLSVCYTKETRYAEALSRAKAETAQVVANNKKLQAEVKSLTESLDIERTNSTRSGERVASLRDTVKSTKGKVTSLTESLSSRDAEIKELKESMTTLRESYTKRCNELRGANEKLQESLVEAQKDAKIAKSQATAKVAKAQELVERYKGIARTAVDKYIASQATRLGISPTEIKKSLNENYSFNDVDRVCESLKQYRLNVNSLPFDISRAKKPVTMTIKESQEPIKRVATDDGDSFDDGIDEMLKGFM